MSVQGVRKAPEELANVAHLHYSHVNVKCLLDAEKLEENCCILESLHRDYKSPMCRTGSSFSNSIDSLSHMW